MSGERVSVGADDVRTLDSSIITHLNDEHGWSREWIALEVVRPNEEQADVDDFPTAA